MIQSKFPELLHGGDYNPEQWMKQKDTIWRQDMEYARKAGINTLSIGIFSWSFLEPEDGVYDFAWMDEVMDNLAANEIKAVLATPSGARPPWLAEKYPSVLRMTNERMRRVYGGRHNSCLSSPDYRRKVTEINTRLAQRYANHPALAIWHISNEYNNDCHCPLCQARFQEWLRARYGTIDQLNDCWWNSFWSHRYTSFEQVESPTSPSWLGENESPAAQLAWKRFCTDNLVDFFNMEIAPLRQATPDIPVTANMMGTFTGLDYYKLGRAMDISSWDNYPQWTGDERDVAVSEQSAFKHDLMRGVSDQKPFLLMESSPSAVNWFSCNRIRTPGTLMYQSMQAIAHGSDSVQYFQFRAGRGGSEQYHGAVINHTGSANTRVFREVTDVGAALKQIAPVAGSVTRNQVALLYDWNDRWALDIAWFLHRGNQKYEETVLDHHAALSMQGIGIDMIDQDSEIDAYRVVVAPMAYLIRDGFSEKIEKFVQNGGRLVLTYASGYVNEESLTFQEPNPCLLHSIAGIRVDEIDALDDRRTNHFIWNGKRYEVKEVAELSTLDGAKQLAGYEEQFYAEKPMLTVHPYGDGCCYYIAARTDADFLCDLYDKVLAEAGISLLATEMTDGVKVTARYDGDNQYVFLMNSSHAKGTATVTKPMRDLQTGELIDGMCTVQPMSIRVLVSAN
ncbi:MAG: beta-galactosidase [Clostridiales bacterium]|nr:beta-galactosidase [Clostridiales bacterium]